MAETKVGGGGKQEKYDPETGKYVKSNKDNFIEQKITTPYFNEHINNKLLAALNKKNFNMIDRIDTNVTREEDRQGIDARMYFKTELGREPMSIDLKVMTGKLGKGEDVPEGYDFIIRKQDDHSGEDVVNATLLKDNLTDCYVISYYKSYKKKKFFNKEERKDDILGSYSVFVLKDDLYKTVANKYKCGLEEVKTKLQTEADELINLEKQINEGNEKPKYLERPDGIYKIYYDDNNPNKVYKIKKRGKYFDYSLAYNERNQVNVKVNIKFADMLNHTDSVEVDEMENRRLYESMGMSEKDIRYKTQEERIKEAMGL